jgi:hypothetical protein
MFPRLAAAHTNLEIENKKQASGFVSRDSSLLYLLHQYH